MIRLQKPIALLSITLLLFSNFAGWVHVHQAAEDYQTTDGSPNATGQLHSLCCHHQCSDDLGGTARSQKSDANATGTHSEVPGVPHDSENCSTCRLLFTLRQSADLSSHVDLAHFEPLVTERLVLSCESAASQWDERSVTSRGPPLV